MVTGTPYRKLSFNFRISKTAISNIVKEVCTAIWKTLVIKHMPIPTTELWKSIAKDFWEKWQFPNCIGSLDGKHVRIKKPKKSGSMYYNYKGFFSIVLLALTDANYKFIMVDIGAYGKDNDAGVFDACTLKQAIEHQKLQIPEPDFLPNTLIKAPFVFVGDAAFPLKTYLLKPYAQKNVSEGDIKERFNHRLSRARMVVECSFGSIASRFGLLNTPIETDIENTINTIKAITLLHNIIRDLESNCENLASTSSPDLRRSRRYNASSQAAIHTREIFANYFNEH